MVEVMTKTIKKNFIKQKEKTFSNGISYFKISIRLVTNEIERKFDDN